MWMAKTSMELNRAKLFYFPIWHDCNSRRVTSQRHIIFRKLCKSIFSIKDNNYVHKSKIRWYMPSGNFCVHSTCPRTGVNGANIVINYDPGGVSTCFVRDGRISQLWTEKTSAECRNKLFSSGELLLNSDLNVGERFLVFGSEKAHFGWEPAPADDDSVVVVRMDTWPALTRPVLVSFFLFQAPFFIMLPVKCSIRLTCKWFLPSRYTVWMCCRTQSNRMKSSGFIHHTLFIDCTSTCLLSLAPSVRSKLVKRWDNHFLTDVINTCRKNRRQIIHFSIPSVPP